MGWPVRRRPRAALQPARFAASFITAMLSGDLRSPPLIRASPERWSRRRRAANSPAPQSACLDTSALSCLSSSSTCGSMCSARLHSLCRPRAARLLSRPIGRGPPTREQLLQTSGWFAVCILYESHVVEDSHVGERGVVLEDEPDAAILGRAPVTLWTRMTVARVGRLMDRVDFPAAAWPEQRGRPCSSFSETSSRYVVTQRWRFVLPQSTARPSSSSQHLANTAITARPIVASADAGRHSTADLLVALEDQQRQR